uniref:Probable glutathione S-transferase n=2 Tax=Helianthus annuus TaxID=4232 RepID=A0A251UJ96_HELAN
MNPATEELIPVHQKMEDEVKLHSFRGSPYGCRVEIALKLKGIKYEFIQEDLSNKSQDLLKYNPVYKKVPVFVHNGNPISESLVIIEYIDEVWKGVPILPQDAYTKAQARFWAKFIDEKCIPAVFKVFGSHGDEQDVAEANEQLQFLENELSVKGNKFFGGDNIGLVDICASYIAFWAGAAEEALGIELVTKDKFPKLKEWCDNCINCQVVKDGLPPRERLVAYYKWRFGKALCTASIDVNNKQLVLCCMLPMISFPNTSVLYVFFLFKVFGSHGDEQDVAEANEQLQFLENELSVKGNKFFGGDNIGLVDICASYIAFWAGAAEEALGIELVTKDKFPKLKEWCDNCINCQVVKDGLPPRERLVAYYKWRFGKA